MSGATYFVQDCPVCGRYLQVKIELLGKTVICRHCQGKFIASDPTHSAPLVTDEHERLINRADELLSAAGEFRPRPR
jgi:hypothetical protein